MESRRRPTRAVVTRVLVAWVLFAAGCAQAGGKPPGAQEARIRPSADQVGQYDRLELTIELPGGTFANPFDPNEVDLQGIFHCPSGKTVVVPAYYYLPYARSPGEGGGEVLTRAGEGRFAVRFAGREVGAHRYEVVQRTAAGTQQLGSGRFTVVPSKRTGYVRIDANSHRYFKLDSGHPYFAIGENMCWPIYGGTEDYDEWLPKLASHGGNYIRLVLSGEWNLLALEHLPLEAGDEAWVGRYDQVAAWRVDYILDLANQLGVKAMVDVEPSHSLYVGDYGSWESSSYNAENGGPREQPWEFWTDADAKRLFKRRLRYLVARYGYQSSVLSWELFSEAEGAAWGKIGYSPEVVAAWYQEMAQYLRGLDPWGHLITASSARKEGEPLVDALAEMDYVQSHAYGTHDVAGMISGYCRQKTEAYGKPHYVGEFGTDTEGEGNLSDPEGINLHNGLWSSMLSRSAGTAMIWWHDWYVDGQDLYDVFQPVAAFAADVDWVTENYDYADPVALEFLPGHEPTGPTDMAIEPWAGDWWADSPCNQAHTFTVRNDGTVSDMEFLSDVRLGSFTGPDSMHVENTASFLVDYPAPGRFKVIVYGVSGLCGSKLSMSLDGFTTIDEPFWDVPYEDVVTHEYDGSYGIDVPAGPHTIVVDNLCGSWFYASYRLTNYLTSPNLRVLALSNGTSALVWVQNKMHTWWNHAQGVTPQPVGSSMITLGGFVPGVYAVEQWDTYNGVATNLPPYRCTDGSVTLTTSDGLLADVAYKLRRVE